MANNGKRKIIIGDCNPNGSVCSISTAPGDSVYAIWTALDNENQMFYIDNR